RAAAEAPPATPPMMTMRRSFMVVVGEWTRGDGAVGAARGGTEKISREGWRTWPCRRTVGLRVRAGSRCGCGPGAPRAGRLSPAPRCGASRLAARAARRRRCRGRQLHLYRPGIGGWRCAPGARAPARTPTTPPSLRQTLPVLLEAYRIFEI